MSRYSHLILIVVALTSLSVAALDAVRTQAYIEAMREFQKAQGPPVVCTLQVSNDFKERKDLEKIDCRVGYVRTSYHFKRLVSP